MNGMHWACKVSVNLSRTKESATIQNVWSVFRFKHLALRLRAKPIHHSRPKCAWKPIHVVQFTFNFTVWQPFAMFLPKHRWQLTSFLIWREHILDPAIRGSLTKLPLWKFNMDSKHKFLKWFTVVPVKVLNISGVKFQWHRVDKFLLEGSATSLELAYIVGGLC